MQVLQLWNTIATSHHKDISEFPALPLHFCLWELCKTEAMCSGHRPPQREIPPWDNSCMKSLEGQLITESHWRWTGTTTGSPKATKTSSSLKSLEVQLCDLYDWVNLCQPLGFQIGHWAGFEIVTTTSSKSYFSKGYPEEGLIKSLPVTLLQNNSYSVPKH